MASETAEQRSTNLAKANEQKTTAESALSAGNYLADLIPQIVPVGFKVVTVKNPTSGLTDTAAKALAQSLGLEFYEE